LIERIAALDDECDCRRSRDSMTQGIEIVVVYAASRGCVDTTGRHVDTVNK